ncbi:DUF4292 domain-containing protein [Sunxiuqinia sp. A32]|uniref:DUF4292 domain-containing protein n=1 Tax=Sunxiuqinia sp. A32 TaxID=3461496 RepID=UPI0040457204
MKTRLLRYIPQSLLILFIGAVSCKAPSTLTTERVKSISTNRLIRNVEDNAFDYKWLSIKRIGCQYETSEGKTSFRASLKSEKDERIWLSFSKLNVPVGRLLLTPDSVKFINYMEKNYFLKEYDYFSNFVNADIDFDVIQSILNNSPFSYRDDPRDNDYKEFVSYVDSGMYVLQSIKNRKLGKIVRKGKEDKIDRYLKKMDEDELIIQYLYIDPKTFKIRKIILDDQSNDRKVRIDFSEFEKVENQLYPGNIDINFDSPDKNLKMKVKLSKFSMEKDQNFNFNIPDRYSLIQ